MPYQGSASSIGFRNRPVFDGSKRKRQEAAEIEAQGKERVRGMERQASQQIREMQRLSNIEAENSAYELKALSKFSDSINNLLQNEVLDAEIRRREGLVQEGKQIYAEQGAEYEAQKNEVNEAGNKSYELHSNLNSLAAKAPNPEAGDQVRKLSRWQQHGYDLAAMQETGERFGLHLMAEMEQNETLIRDPETGKEFKVNKPNKTRSEFEAAKGYIYGEYVKDNSGNMSSKVVNTVLIPAMEQTSKQYTKDFYTQKNTEEAQEILDMSDLTLDKGLSGVNGYPTDPTILINGYMADRTAAYTKMRLSNPKKQARLDLYEALKTRVRASPEKVDEIIAQVNEAQIKGHPAGPGTLFTLYGKEFTANDLKGVAYQAQKEKYDQRLAERRMEATAKFKGFRQAVINGLSGEERRRAIEELKQYEADFPTEYASAIGFEPQIPGYTQSTELAESLLESQNGKISEEQAEKLDLKLVNELREKGVIVDELFTDGLDTKEAFNTIDGTVRIAINENDAMAALDENTRYVQARAKVELLKLAEQIYEDQGGKISKTAALDQATRELGKRIRLEAESSDPSLDYFVDPDQGFVNFQLQKGQVYGTTRRNNYQATILDYEQNQKSKSKDAVINEKLVIDPSMLEPTADGGPPSIFYDLARRNGRHTAWEIWLAQRDKHGIKERIEMPDDAAKVDLMLKQYPTLVPLFQRPSYKRVQRGLVEIGGVSRDRLMVATGTQESGNDYKAINKQVDPNNPAMGKYQILWTTAVGWARQFGMPHPGSVDEFLNDPGYQEEMARRAFDNYLRIAGQQTDDPDVAIRMAAAAWYGGDGAMDEWDNPNYQGGAPDHPNMQEYTMQVLQRYKRGE